MSNTVWYPIFPDGYDPKGRESQSFVLNQVKWGSSTPGTSGGMVTWSFATSNLSVQPSDVTFQTMPVFFQDEVRAAFDAWQAVSNIDFVEVSDGSNVDIRVGVGAIDGSGGTLGVAHSSFTVNLGAYNTFSQVHIIMDSSDYNSSFDSSEFYTTTLHEIGHAIGLGHEDFATSIMGTFANPSVKGLTSDDINGAQAIYGNSLNPGTGDNDDIFPDSTATNGAISVPGTVSGTANFPLDDDFYAVDLVAGRQYQFDVIGGTLSQPILQLVDPTFTKNLQLGYDDVEGVDYRLSFVAQTTGTYFIGVRGNNNTFGTYTLTAADIGATVPGLIISEGGNDALATTSTTHAIVPGDSFQGSLSNSSDQDWVKIDLLPRRFYTFELKGADSGGGTLADPFLILRDAQGVFILQSDDEDGTRDSSISYFVQDIGPHYINVRTFGDGGGTYTVVTSPNERNENDPVPIVTIPGIIVDEGSSDAAGNSSTTDTLVSGDTFNGSLDTTADQDWISIQLTAGTTYTFDLQGKSSDAGTLADGFLVLRDADGNFVSQDDDSGTGTDARLTFSPNSTATYFITVRTFGAEGGTYTLVTSPEERTEDDPSQPTEPEPEPVPTIPGIVVAEGADDAPGSADTAVTLVSGDTFEGELESGSDKDWVGIQLTAGTAYTFDLEGQDTDGGTLSDPFLVLRNSSGNFIAQDDDGGEKLNAQISFTPDSSGTYYLEARNFDGETGTYTLSTSPEERTADDGDGSLTPDPTPDPDPTPNPGVPVESLTVDEDGNDVPASTETPISLVGGDTFFGDLDNAGDRDWVAIELDAGTRYRFDVQGTDVGSVPGGAVEATFLVLRDSSGNFLEQDDGNNITSLARIFYTPPTSGTYYLEVRTFGSEGGRYVLSSLPEERTSTDPIPLGVQSLQEAASEGYQSSGDADATEVGFVQMLADTY